MGIFTQGPGVFFLFVAFVLLVCVSVGCPIWNRVDFLSATVGGERVQLGQWGFCANVICSRSRLGYRADDVVDLLGNTGEISGTIIHGLTYALVLHPIAAGIALIALIVSLTTSVILDILGSLISGLAFLMCFIALILDSSLFVTAKSRINSNVNGSPANLGPAYWLVVVATILLLLAFFTVCFGSARARRNKRAERNSYATQPVMAETPKRHFWQRNRY